ncbi:hypothetical protein [Ferribacterium limneticum]|uniref:hypothetical protein n=1 Tax=Ferribacterium limneticum TaxID=76259 RepID=UPI001CF82A9F|nr:hypothetical protein [Ferribacterium limneticum]UCV21491.1 hypothetical protein KI613_13160 [Ferribacterium limneticum]
MACNGGCGAALASYYSATSQGYDAIRGVAPRLSMTANTPGMSKPAGYQPFDASRPEPGLEGVTTPVEDVLLGGVKGIFAVGDIIKSLAGEASRDLTEVLVAKGLGNQNPLFKAAVEPFKNSELSNAGRALTKHPELVGETKDTLRQSLRTDSAINDTAHDALKNIMRNGVTTTPSLGRYGTVTQIQIPGGFGARWGADGGFIGFINP